MALLVTIAAIAYGAGPYLAIMAGFKASVNTTVVCAIVMIVLATLINYGGTKVLSAVAIFGFAAELIGALIVGFWLLFTERYHGLDVLFDDFGTAGDGSYLPVFLAAGIIGLYQYYGFEACGDTAEEVKDPGIVIPKAMRRTIYVGGAAASFACLTLLLAVPSYQAVISGREADPLVAVLNSAFGTTGARVVMAVVLISFLSCTISLQAAAGRLTYSYGRDEMIVGHTLWRKFSEKRHIPPYALGLAGVVPALVVVGSLISTDEITKLASFAILGIYLAFQMVVLASLRARVKGWKPTGKFQLGRLGMAVNVGALAYGVGAMINISWPRTPNAPWYDNYIVLLSGAVVVGVGLVYMFTTHHYGRSDAKAGDAVPAQRG